MKRPWVADFETKSIDAHPRPGSPPPVGLALWPPGKDPLYFAWDHPTENGAYKLSRGSMVDVSKQYPDPKRAATIMLKDAYKEGVLGHNIAKFDLPVAEDHLGLKPPIWEMVDDTLFTLFLRDPHSPSLSLKPSAERWLGEKPEERDAVYEWLAEHGIIKPPKRKNGVLKYQKDAGAFICKAPGKLVGEYAIGDLTRTWGVFKELQPWVREKDMQRAYDTERELAPMLLDNERRGIRVDVKALARDVKIYRAALAKADEWLRKRFGAKAMNLDSDDEVAAALRKSKVVKEFPKTPTGKDSVSKKNLTIDYFADPKVFHALYYRNALSTVLTQSMEKWLNEADQNGYIFREWNQVRQSHGNDNRGARSGRITVSGLQNITKDFMDRGDGYEHPAFLGVPELPLVRMYVLADPGELFGHSDYDQQELKLVAHYEDGALAEEYRRNPKADIHTFVQNLVHQVSGKLYERRPIKIVDFRTAYGGGIQGLADTLRIPYKDAKQIIHDWKEALPDVVELDSGLKKRFKQGLHVRTLGGRVYFVKPPAIAKKGPNKGRLIEFSYTALNYLIQPSAADQTKRALINYHKHPKRKARLLATVHDEINISMAKARAKEELRILQECMVGAYKLDVPVTTTLKMGDSWGALKKVE